MQPWYEVMKTAAFLLLSLFIANSYADQPCESMVYNKQFPRAGVTDGKLLCHLGFVSYFGQTLKEPVWVAEHLKRENLIQPEQRDRQFGKDPLIAKDKQGSDADYAANPYDAGHMAPVTDMVWSVDAQRDTMVYTNAVPQLASNNRGVWKSIEAKVKKQAIDQGELYVITGPTFEGTPELLGPDKLKIPTQLWKVVLHPNTLEVRSYLVPNEDVKGLKPENFLTTLEEVERYSGVRLFPGADYSTFKVQK